MKLTLIFMFCLVCYGVTNGSYHQQPQYRNYRTFYEPRLAFYYPAQANQDLYFPEFNEGDYSSVSDQLSDYIDTEARGPTRAFANQNKPQSKLIRLNNLISQLLNNNNSPITIFPQTTFTSTVLQTSTSLITTASIKSCISSLLFSTIPAVAANAAQNIAATPAIPLTTPCARKRRASHLEIEAFGPTQVEPLESTEGVHLMPLSRSSLRGMDQPEIFSSKDLSINEEKDISYRQKRNVVVSVTSIVTAYSFVASPVVKYFPLVGAVNLLACLPAGFTIC